MGDQLTVYIDLGYSPCFAAILVAAVVFLANCEDVIRQKPASLLDGSIESVIDWPFGEIGIKCRTQIVGDFEQVKLP